MRRFFACLLLATLAACAGPEHDIPALPDVWNLDGGGADGFLPPERDAADERDLGVVDAVVDAGADLAGPSDLGGPADVPELPGDVGEDTGPQVPDPTDIAAWEPEGLGPHPRLFFSAADLPALRERAAAGEGPHAALYATLRTYAAQEHATNDGATFDHGRSIARSQSAEAAALVAEIEEDAALAAKAAEMVAAAFTPPVETTPFDNYGIHEAEALVGWCTAYDIVAGSALVADDAKAAARARLIERVTTYRRILTEPIFMLLNATVFNNHPAKSLSALGMCALALNDHPQAALDIHDGLTGLLYIFRDFQASEDGGFGEGWNYLVYGDNNYLPFLMAYHRFAAGRTLPYKVVGTFTSSRDERTGQIVDVVDPALDPAVRIVYERALQSSFPDGTLPNTDDANPSRLHGGLLAALFDDGRFLANWLQTGHHGGRTRLATFATLDPALEAVAPDWAPDQCHVEAGFALLRSDLGEEALWLLIQGEHGTVRVGGVGHEHPDATNLLLWAAGEPLLIDPGYIEWGEHERVCAATDHNTILVDGAGPPYPSLGADVGVDAYLEDWEEGERRTGVVVRSAWQGVEVSRRLVRVDGRFFVVADRLVDPAGAGHVYTYQMNGMGGGDLGADSFALRDDGARWSGANAAIDVRVYALEGEALATTRLEEHATGHGTWEMHAQLGVEVEMGADAGFLSLLLPTRHDESAPTVTASRPRDGLVTAQVAFADEVYTIELSVEDGLTISGEGWPSGAR